MTNKDIARIRCALEVASKLLAKFSSERVVLQRKSNGDPVTEADRAVDKTLRELLPEPGEGWLSEETADNLERLRKRRVWIVDPIDGTAEFIAGIPEWCVSIALVEEGRVIAGGICNPVKGEVFSGSIDHGVTLNGERISVTERRSLCEATVLASRSEVGRGEWSRFEKGLFKIIPVGSVAYKLALVAAGKADFTFSLQPKNEWDIVAGAFLVEAAGGRVSDLDGKKPTFNNYSTLCKGIVAGAPGIFDEVWNLINQVNGKTS